MAATPAAEADGSSAVVTRLFVGGLAEGVSAADLEAVFGSIGRVAGVEFVRTSGRSFAYVDFHCPSHKALTKLFSTYNGCKWKGGKLKLEKAKEHYLVRLKREWEQEAAATAAAHETPAEDDVEKQEDKEKRKLEKEAMQSSKVNIYFPKLRKLKPLPFKGSGKHKYSFRNIEVPSYPIHFCDCEEHCGPPEKANEEYAAVLNRVAYEKERNIMNSVMSKLIEKETEVQKREDVVDIMEPSDAETEPSDTETEPSDSENDLQMEETTETPEEDLDDLQMEETDSPSEEELDDDLVINIAPRKASNAAVQLNKANQAVNKDEQFRKRQQIDETSPQKKRQKSEDLSEPRNKKQSTSMTAADRRNTGKSLPAVSIAIQKEQKSSGLTGKEMHGFSSVLDRAKSSAGLQGVNAPTDHSTKNEVSQNEPPTEPKKGSLWTQKSAWRDLVGGVGAVSFSISQVLPNINPAPPKHEPATETSVACTESRREVISSGVKSLESPEAITQPLAEQNLPSSMGAPSTETTVGSVGTKTGENGENKVEEPRVVPKITISEVCPFMRNEESMQQWSKAKKVLTGFIKKGEEKKAGSSGTGRGRPPSRRR